MPGLHELKPAEGARRGPRRRGRGDSAGQGSYSGRGHKGQLKRGRVRAQYEGGQLPLVKRLPYLRGFFNRFRVSYTGVNVGHLEQFEAGSEVNPGMLFEAGILTKWDEKVKVLGAGELSRALKVSAHRVSQSARQKIEAAGGTVTELDPRPEPKVEEPKRPKASKKAAEEATEQPAAEPSPARAERHARDAGQARPEGRQPRGEARQPGEAKAARPSKKASE